MPLETKFAPLDISPISAAEGHLEGYAARFDRPDRAGDVIAPGAFAKGLQARSTSVKFLWQHDAAQPIGIWDRIEEDARGLRVQGRLLTGLRTGAEAATLLAAGALDGLSIGFRTARAERRDGYRRLTEIELWEISLVTFPMSDEARVAPTLRAAEDDPVLAEAIRDASRAFA